MPEIYLSEEEVAILIHLIVLANWPGSKLEFALELKRKLEEAVKKDAVEDI